MIERKKTAFQVALPQIVAVMVKNILLIAFGMTLGYPTILIPGLTSNDPNEEFHLNEEQVSWIGSINLMCVPIGCLLSGFLTTPIGRRRSMQIITFPLAASWVIFKFANQVWHVYLALCVTGLCGGLVEAPVLSYVAEITTPQLRGMLSITSTVSLTLGILLQFVFGTILHWRSVALVSLGPPMLSFCLLCFMPESPHWLIMHKNIEQARKNLAWLRGWTSVEEVEEEFESMCRTHNLTSKIGIDNPVFEGSVNNIQYQTKCDINKKESFLKTKITNSKHFMKKSFVWPISMVSFIYFLAHFTGAWTLQTYAVKIFATLNAPMDKYYATIILGIAEFLGCVISIIFVKNCGKRIMGFVSICAVGLCDIIIGTYAYTNDINYLQIHENVTLPSVPSLGSHNWIPLLFLFLIAFTAHCGIKPLPWILIGEIYSHETRATGCGASSAVAYLFGFLANKVFLNMIGTLTISGTYWFYGSISLLGCIVMYFILPETEGKSLQEITEHFNGLTKLDNKIRKKRIVKEHKDQISVYSINGVSLT